MRLGCCTHAHQGTFCIQNIFSFFLLKSHFIIGIVSENDEFRCDIFKRIENHFIQRNGIIDVFQLLIVRDRKHELSMTPKLLFVHGVALRIY